MKVSQIHSENFVNFNAKLKLKCAESLPANLKRKWKSRAQGIGSRYDDIFLTLGKTEDIIKNAENHKFVVKSRIVSAVTNFHGKITKTEFTSSGLSDKTEKLDLISHIAKFFDDLSGNKHIEFDI